MKKQTSVDFLIEEFSAILGKVNFTAMQGLLLKDAVEKAKEMHEAEVMEAHGDERDYLSDSGNFITISAQQYYNENYKKIETK
jgi:soluble P-type ATPase